MSGGKDPGRAIWLTGLPSSGKTTLAQALAQRLADRGIAVQILDSDDVRRVLTPQPTYTAEERDWFYEVLVFIAGLLVDNGVDVIIAATGPYRRYRRAARERLPHFAEIHVDCPRYVCRERDPKGLWAQAEAGAIDTLPGAGAPYEAPAAPEVRVNTAEGSPAETAQEILAELDRQRFC